jgi:hypothetical protein
MPDGEDPTTRELRIRQADRESLERAQADQSETSEETEEHARRAEKAAYLREKLEERADVESDAS